MAIIGATSRLCLMRSKYRSIHLHAVLNSKVPCLKEARSIMISNRLGFFFLEIESSMKSECSDVKQDDLDELYLRYPDGSSANRKRSIRNKTKWFQLKRWRDVRQRHSLLQSISKSRLCFLLSTKKTRPLRHQSTRNFVTPFCHTSIYYN